MRRKFQRRATIDNLVSVTKFRSFFSLKICVVFLVLFLIGSQNTLHCSDDSFKISDESFRTLSLAESGNVTDIPYVSQQMNGLCHWATQAMALHCAGVSLDLA